MAGGNKKIHEHPKANTNGFDKNPNNINKLGKNGKMTCDVIISLKENGITAVTKNEVKEIFLMLINLTTLQLEQLTNDEEQPALISFVAKEIIKGKGFDVIERMLDRSIGKPDQKTDSTINVQSISDPFQKIRENNEIDEQTKEGD